MKNQSKFTGPGILALAVVLGFVVTGTSQAANGPCGWNVSNVFADVDSNSIPNQFQSDIKGAYVTYGATKTSKDSVSSVIQSGSCDWLLDMSASLSRTIKLTLGPNGSTNPPPPFVGTQDVSAYMISKCSNNPLNNGISYGTLTTAGQSVQCALATAFTYGGKSYALRMNANNFAGTTWVQGTCTGATNGQCNSWTVGPVPNAAQNTAGQPAAIGQLFLDTTVKGQLVQTPIGLYYVAFGITATK